MSPARRALCLFGALATLALAVVLAPLFSASSLSGEAASLAMADLHRPRAVFGAIAGFGLGLCGATLQTVLRNPLASPYTLGIASGAAVGALLGIRIGGAGTLALSSGALLGAGLAALLVYSIAALKRHSPETLLLTGVAVALFASAATTLLHYLALSDRVDLVAMVRWSMASLEVVGYGSVRVAGGFVLVGTLLLLPLVPKLEAASLDDESALALGVEPVQVRRQAFFATSLISAGVVAFAGPIGFVGLIVPHAVRPFTGPDPRLLLPCAACVGGAFLVLCDLGARTLLHPMNLPVNVITYAFGCPAFVWILVRGGNARG